MNIAVLDVMCAKLWYFSTYGYISEIAGVDFLLRIRLYTTIRAALAV